MGGFRNYRRNKIETKEDFYKRCSEILNIEHTYTEPPRRRNRWNTRRLGNGRYTGFGLIQWYGPNCIRVMTKSFGCKVFSNSQEVYDLLTQFMATKA